MEKIIADARLEMAHVEQQKLANEQYQRRLRASLLKGVAATLCFIVLVAMTIYFGMAREAAHKETTLQTLRNTDVAAYVAELKTSGDPRYESELQALRKTDVAAYLAEIKRSGDPRYESEFAVLDSEGYRVFVAERDAAKQRALAEDQAREQRALAEAQAREQKRKRERVANLRDALQSTTPSDLDAIQKIYLTLSELEPESLEVKKKLKSISAQKAQISFCRSDWAKCVDNEQLANNYKDWDLAKVKCKRAASEQAQYGTPVWPWLYFGTFLKGKDYVTSGEAVAIEPDAQFQNGFGAMVHSRVRCTYDLRAQRVVSVDISPR